MRFASGFGTDPAFETALAVLRAAGGDLVEIRKFDDSADRQEREATSCSTELKVDMANYLKSSPAPIAVRRSPT